MWLSYRNTTCGWDGVARSLAEFKISFELTRNATWNEKRQWLSLFRNRRIMWNIMITKGYVWHGQASRLCHGFLLTQRPCEIFISKGSHKFWSTWEALQTQKSFWVYKSQSPKIKNHELLICLNHCPHRSLLRGVGCWYPALYVLLQSFTNLTLELRIIYF